MRSYAAGPAGFPTPRRPQAGLVADPAHPRYANLAAWFVATRDAGPGGMVNLKEGYIPVSVGSNSTVPYGDDEYTLVSGVSNWINCGDIREIAGAQRLTLSCWFQRSNPAADSYYGKTENVSTSRFNVTIQANGLTWFTVNAGTLAYNTFAGPTDYIPHSLIWLFDGTQPVANNRLVALLDGKVVTMTYNTAMATAIPVNAAPFSIGRLQYNSTTYTSNMRFDDLRIYNDVLTIEECRELADPIARWGAVRETRMLRGHPRGPMAAVGATAYYPPGLFQTIGVF